MERKIDIKVKERKIEKNIQTDKKRKRQGKAVCEREEKREKEERKEKREKRKVKRRKREKSEKREKREK